MIARQTCLWTRCSLFDAVLILVLGELPSYTATGLFLVPYAQSYSMHQHSTKCSVQALSGMLVLSRMLENWHHGTDGASFHARSAEY